MRAKNLTLICLSGTPFINSPFELTILFNLLRGNIKSFGLKLKILMITKQLKILKIFLIKLFI